MKTFNHSQEDNIREILMGHRVINVEIFSESIRLEGKWGEVEGKLTLDNGQMLYVIPNKGGCSCSSGDYDLTSLERVDNLITRVDFETPDSSKWGDVEGAYRIFVLAGHERINLLSIEGSDGNGYYGTGYELVVVDVPGI